MAELQQLLSRLKSTADDHGSQAQPGYHQPTVSSPIFAPSPAGPQPHHASAIISPNTSALNTPAPEQSSATKSTDLLSLLRFKQGSGSATASPTASAHHLPATSASPVLQARPVPETDAVASFVRKPSSIGSMASPSLAAATASRPELRGEASSSSANPQDFLLKLLNQAKPPQSPSEAQQLSSVSKPDVLPQLSDIPVRSIELDAPAVGSDGLDQSVGDALAEQAELGPQASPELERKSSPIRVFGEPSPEPSSFQPPAVQRNSFTYVNPFEQISASSPHNRTPVHKDDTEVAISKPAKLSRDSTETNGTPAGNTPPPLHTSTKTEKVAEKVDELGESVDKEVKQALADMRSKASGDSLPEMAKNFKEEVQEAARELKEELKQEVSREAMEAGMPKPMAEAFEATVEAVAAENPPSHPDDWEAQASPTSLEAIRVFNFPMRPFISIDIKILEEKPVKVTSNMVTEIARLKKDFDQIDRNLCTATQNFIVYPLKSGGLRIISQDNGQHKHVFGSNEERIFNVQIGRSMKFTNSSNSASRDAETVLGTGVDGAVFWTSLANFPKDHLYDDNWEGRGFIFPARQEQENTSGGQLKTRVKASTRNPEYFAYGRGKYIYIIWPQIARSTSYTHNRTRRCDSEKYFSEHGLKIATGKAGKDFAFSADDTVIASLDKAGKLKFWDIRKLTDGSTYGSDFEPHDAVEVKEPITQFLTAPSPNEKTWPTSVMFLDKERPMTKGIALRYVLVGMKQNHTLQLWDLTLGKPVQEVNFPHEQESDAICSLAYHSKTGILAVGHPTRNSIYLLHVSAPKYNLSPMSQAKYMTMLGNKDKHLPVPDSTIIISGCREYTLGTRGHLRSLDMLGDPVAMPEDDSPPLFELYVMHSRGITNVVITRKMLGWSKEGKIIHPVDALKVGAIAVNALPPPPTPIVSAATSTNGEPSLMRDPKPAKESSAREQAPRSTKLNQAFSGSAADTETPLNGGGEKAEKKKKKKAAETAPVAPAVAPPAVNSPVPSPARKAVELPFAATRAVEAEPPVWAAQLLAKAGMSPPSSEDAKATMEHLESTMNTEFSNLYRRIAEDRRVQDAANLAKQDAVLRLVSTSLTESVEPVFSRIVNEQLTKMMVGPMKDIVIQTIDRNLAAAFANSMKSIVPKEIEKALPVAMGQVSQQPGVLRAVAEQLGATIARHVDGFINSLVQDKLIPAYTQLAMSAAQAATAKVQTQLNEELRLHGVQRQHDAAKIEHLMKSVSSLQDVIAHMTEQQAKFQNELINVIQQQGPPVSSSASPPPDTSSERVMHRGAKRPVPVVEKTPVQIEREGIQQLLEEGQYEPAAIQWLQSTRQSALFDELFAPLSPQLLNNMSPLVILSVCTAVSFEFIEHIPERLAWLEIALNLTQPRDKDFVEVYPRIMEILSQRLHRAYMELADQNINDPLLRRISLLARRANDLQKMTSDMGATGGGAGSVSGARRMHAE